MTLREEVLRCIDDIPERSMPLLLQFVHFLRESPAVTEKPKEKKKRDRPRLFGVLKGQVWMSDDFNDPMDFVSEDEQRVLEALRTSKREAQQLQEAAI